MYTNISKHLDLQYSKYQQWIVFKNTTIKESKFEIKISGLHCTWHNQKKQERTWKQEYKF